MHRLLFRPTRLLQRSSSSSDPLRGDYFNSSFEACVRYNDRIVSLPLDTPPQSIFSLFLSTAYTPPPRPPQGSAPSGKPKAVPGEGVLRNERQPTRDRLAQLRHSKDEKQAAAAAAVAIVKEQNEENPTGDVKDKPVVQPVKVKEAAEDQFVKIPGTGRLVSVTTPPEPDFIFNDVNYSTTLKRVKEAAARRGGSVAPCQAELDLLLKLISKNLNMFAPRSLSSVAGSLVNLGLNNHPLFDDIAKDAMVKIREFNPHDLAILSWSFARAGQYHEDLFRVIDQYSRKIAYSALGPDLTTLVWAFAKTGFGNETLFAEFEKAFVRLHYLNSQSLATMVWSWAKLGIRSPSLFTFVEKKMLSVVRNYEPQTISNVIWAYGKAGICPPELMGRLTSQAAEKVNDLLPQHLSNISSSLVSLGYSHPPLMESIRTLATRRVNDFKAITLAEIAGAYATLSPHSPENIPLFSVISRNISAMGQKIEREKILSAKINSELIAAFARQGVITEGLLDLFSTQTTFHAPTMVPHSAADAAWGLAELNKGTTEPQLALLESRLQLGAKLLSPSQLVLSTWALAFFRAPFESFLTEALGVINGLRASALDQHALALLSQLGVASQTGLVQLPVQISPVLLKEAGVALRAREKERQQELRFLDDSAMHLRQYLSPQLRGLVKVNHVTEDGLQLQVSIPEKRFVFELLPPQHFIEDLVTNKRWATGESRVRTELLKKRGWKVASMQEFAWSALKPEKKQELARRLASTII